MGRNDTCTRCGGRLDPETDHHVSLSRTSVDVQTAARETTEQLFCTDCGLAHLDLESLVETG